MFPDNSIPQGSPLVQWRPPAGPRSLTGSFAPVVNAPPAPRSIPTLSPAAPASLAQPLSSPPPSKLGKRPTIWDQDHISETLARIGAGFFSGQNFSDGLGAAASSIADRTRDLRAEGMKSTSYGGPDDQFEITTDAQGNHSYREVPEFAKAAREKREAAKALGPKDTADIQARVIHAIAGLPKEQRQAALDDVRANAGLYSVDASRLPTTWSDIYGQVGGSLGMSVNQAVTADQSDAAAEARKAAEAARLARTDRRLDQGDRRLGQSDARETRLRSAPPSTRSSSKGYSSPKSRADFDALPRGAKFLAPDGSLRIKQ